MKIKTTITKEFSVSTLIVEAGVRHWEDAAVNCIEDTDGTLIPFREDELWKPVIGLDSGIIQRWPSGITARIHYKVCDAGQYWLGEANGIKVLKWKGDYVPDRLLCVGDLGYGDYIILNVNGFGQIEGWRAPQLDGGEWQAV